MAVRTHTRTPNPVLQAELRHQYYVMEQSRSGLLWIILAVLLLVPALIASLVFFVRAMSGMPAPLLPQNDSFAESLLQGGAVALLTMNVAQYLVVTMVSFALATNSIAREKRNKTWDTLLLTNVSARQIVMGKFWASLRAMVGDHSMVGLLRLGMIAFVPMLPDVLRNPESVTTGELLLLAVLLLAATALDAVLNTAASLFTMLLALPGAVGVSIFMMIRLMATIGWLLWLVLTVHQMVQGSALSLLIAGPGGLLLLALTALAFLRLAEVAAVRGSRATPTA